MYVTYRYSSVWGQWSSQQKWVWPFVTRSLETHDVGHATFGTLSRDLRYRSTHSLQLQLKYILERQKGKKTLSRHLKETLHWCLNMYYAHPTAGAHKSRVTEFCKVAPKICRSSQWNWLHVTLLSHNILCSLYFCKACGPLPYTPWCRVLLENLTGLQLVKKFPAFHWTRRFIDAHSQASATCLYPGPAQSSPHTHIPPPGDPS